MLEFVLLMNRGISLLSDDNSPGVKHRHLPNKPPFTPVFPPKRTQILVMCSPPHMVHDSGECDPTAGTRSSLHQSQVIPPPPSLCGFSWSHKVRPNRTEGRFALLAWGYTFPLPHQVVENKEACSSRCCWWSSRKREILEIMRKMEQRGGGSHILMTALHC